MSTSRDRKQQTSARPISTSIHDQPARPYSYAESYNAGSSRSAAWRSQTRSNGGEEMKESPDPRNGSFGSEDQTLDLLNGTIKRVKRSSGGFLLDSSPSSSRLSRSLLSRKSTKGKHKQDEQTLAVPKTRAQVDGAGSPSMRGSSPLSAEVDFGSQVNPAAPGSPTSQRETARQQGNGSERSRDSGFSNQNRSSYGFDTDPAQIVEMALRLNEARRRQASSRRQAASATEGRRIISTATSLGPRSSPRYDSKHQSVKRKGLNPEPATPYKRARGLSGQVDEPSPNLAQELSPEHDSPDAEDDMHISRATQNRVAKAKQYFELAYEHRRLLSHLPPLRPPDAPYDPAKPGSDSKAYNPLQYARNRKLRFRERAPINSEAEGWHDVLKVRAWVDAVISSHQETKHEPLECVRLPPLNLVDDASGDDDTNANTVARRVDQTGRPRRPKSDWVTHPGDLIADAYWTEQGPNKGKICNRDDEPIFPAGTQFRFSGWRNQTPVKVPDELKQVPSSPDSSPVAERQRAVAALPSLPVFESAHKDNSWARTRSKFSKAIKKGSKNRKTPEENIFDTSSDSPDSSKASDSEKEDRGRGRLSKRRDKLDLADGDPYAPAVQTSAQADEGDLIDVRSSRHDSWQDSASRGHQLNHRRENSGSVGTGTAEHHQHKSDKRRNLLASLKLESDDRGRSSFENDSTAPSTPVGSGFPSIAINLSPPESRSPSPSRRGKGSFFGVVKDKVQPRRDRVDRSDFAKGQESNQSSKRGSIARVKNLSIDQPRGPSPMSRGTSPFTRQQTRKSTDEPQGPAIEPRGSTVSKVSSRTMESDRGRPHRVRGMFKGGRIAELVGNEVSRVGDFIWKRDPPRPSGTDSESSSGYESDSDDLDDAKDESATTLDRPSPSRANTAAKDTALPSAGSRSSPKSNPQYHIQGLPSFTSPFQRDRELQNRKKSDQSPGGTPQNVERNGYDSDPVSTGAAARRAAGKSPRFDRLAPPKLDIHAATPDGRRTSYGFGAALDLSRTRSASQLYNDAINGRPVEISKGKENSSKAISPSEPPAPSVDLKGYRSDENRSRSHHHRKGTKQDLIRTRALLLATTIKAANIAAYCEGIPKPQSSFLFSAFRTTGASGSEINQHLPARRKEEHIIAARHLIAHLSQQSSDFNEHLEHFTQHTTQNLHKEIQILEGKTNNTLFPRLQTLSDQAGQLAQKLTTTSTLAVKSVNDEVAEAMRMKRRGPFRFGRALGYKLIEWAVVSILWLIWLNVTVIRFVLGIIRAIWIFVTWLVFLR